GSLRCRNHCYAPLPSFSPFMASTPLAGLPGPRTRAPRAARAPRPTSFGRTAAAASNTRRAQPRASEVPSVSLLLPVRVHLLKGEGVVRRLPNVAVAVLGAGRRDELLDHRRAVAERVAAVRCVVVIGLARKALTFLIELKGPIAQHLQTLRARRASEAALRHDVARGVDAVNDAGLRNDAALHAAAQELIEHR